MKKWEPCEITTINYKKNGEEFWINFSISPVVNEKGWFTHWISIDKDVTERIKEEKLLKESEEKYRTLVEQATDAIALYDASGKVLDVNTGSAILLGYTKEELIGKSLKEILLEEDLIKNPIQYEVLQQGQSTVKERKMRKNDGTIVQTEVRSQQLPDGRFLSVIRDLSQRIKAEKDLDESYKAIRKLTSHIQNVREEERTNIAREIHDELGQQLTVMKMDVSWINKKLVTDDEIIKEKVKGMLTMLDETVKSVRRISSELRPSLLDDLGLTAAMEWQLFEIKKRSGIKINFNAPEKELKLPDLIKTGLFRIFQESLTNVIRHAGAKSVKVNLEQKDHQLTLSIEDDGKGFDKGKIADKRTLGILGMKERTSMIGGTYEINSIPGKGTVVEVVIPMNGQS
jgi:PAS domain S-box-containing protein